MRFNDAVAGVLSFVLVVMLCGTPARAAEPSSAQDGTAAERFLAGLNSARVCGGDDVPRHENRQELETSIGADVRDMRRGGLRPAVIDTLTAHAAEGANGAEEALSVLQVLTAACGNGLPVRVLEDKYMEGVAKRVPYSRIIPVLNSGADQLDAAAKVLHEIFPVAGRELVGTLHLAMAQGLDARRTAGMLHTCSSILEKRERRSKSRISEGTLEDEGSRNSGSETLLAGRQRESTSRAGICTQTVYLAALLEEAGLERGQAENVVAAMLEADGTPQAFVRLPVIVAQAMRQQNSNNEEISIAVTRGLKQGENINGIAESLGVTLRNVTSGGRTGDHQKR